MKAKGILDNRHLDTLVEGILVLSPVKRIGDSTPFERLNSAMSSNVRRLVLRLFEFFNSNGVSPDLYNYNFIISMSGALADLELFQLALDGMGSCNSLLNSWTYNRLLCAAGRLGDAAMVHEAWTNLHNTWW